MKQAIIDIGSNSIRLTLYETALHIFFSSIRSPLGWH